MAGPPPSDRPRGPLPRDEAELISRARALEGVPLAEIAALLGARDARAGLHTKGMAGELIERALGATGGPSAQVDFPALGVELKTVPVDETGRPRESTFVCTIPLAEADRATWATSWVRRKLAVVLWVPLVTGPRRAPAAPSGSGTAPPPATGTVPGDDTPGPPGPRVGRVVLWRPTPAQEAVLAADFDEIVGLIGAGGVEALTARVGRWLQARPKAAHSRARTLAFGPEGERTSALPRGFYLRARFTGAILRDPFAVPE